MKSFKTIEGDIERHAARLMGISLNSAASDRSWKETLEIDLPLLSDQDGWVATS